MLRDPKEAKHICFSGDKSTMLGYGWGKREVTWQERYMPTPNLSSLLCMQRELTVSILGPDPHSGRRQLASSKGCLAGKPLGDSTLAHRRGMGGKGIHSNTWKARMGRVCRRGSSKIQLAFSAQRSLLSPRIPFPPVQASQTPSQTRMLQYYKILFSLRTI